jgi:hypothetical protein
VNPLVITQWAKNSAAMRSIKNPISTQNDVFRTFALKTKDSSKITPPVGNDFLLVENIIIFFLVNLEISFLKRT